MGSTPRPLPAEGTYSPIIAANLQLSFKLQLVGNQFEKFFAPSRVRGGEMTLRLRDMIIATE
jgi:hypothetical protein